MRSNVLRIFVSAAVLALFSAAGQGAVSVSISMFQNELDPYGGWVDVPSYGTCWSPSRVSADWQPYTVGEWAYTDYGWTWVSNDPWGGTPYHYGTWVWVDGYGWVWIPGTVWAPAWVTWSYSDSYVGWAPISPSIDIGFSGYIGPPVIVSQNYYVFVPVNRFVGVNVASVRVPRQQNTVIFRQTTQRTTNFSVSNGILVNRGPSVQRIEQVAHTRIPRQNVSVARVNPTPISGAGAQKGSRIGVIASAPVRAREIRSASKGGGAAAKGVSPAPAGSVGMTKSEQHPATAEGKTLHEEHKATPQEHKMVHEQKSAAPKQHEAAPQERKMVHEQQNASPKQYRAAPQEHKAIQQERKAGAQERHAAPPPPPPPHEVHREPPPPHEAAASQHGNESSGKGRGSPPGQQKQPNPKKPEKNPPPPPR